MNLKPSFSLCVVLLFMSMPSFSQDAVWKQYNGPFSGDIGAMASFGDTLFCGSRLTGLFKSYDGGVNWTQSMPELTFVHGLFDNDTSLLIGTDKLYSYTSASDELVQLGQQLSGAIVFIHKFHDEIFISTDYSVYKYDPQTNLLVEKNIGLPVFEPGIRWTRDLVSIGDILYCNVIAQGLFKTVDHGESWTQVDMPGPDFGFNSLTTFGDSLLCIADHHVFLTTNNGQSWSDLKYNISDIHAHYDASVFENKIFLATHLAVFVLPSGATTWSKVDDSDGVQYVKSETGKLFISNLGGFYRWDKSAGKFVSSNNGVNTSTVNAIDLYQNKLYAATYQGLHFTTPGSNDWQSVPELAEEFVLTVKRNDSKLYAGSRGGLFVTAGSQTSFQRHTGIPAVAVWEIAIVKNQVFTATDNGVYVSYNKGSSWKLIPRDGSSIGQMYTVVANDTMLIAGNTSGLYKIRSDSTGWERIDGFNEWLRSLNLVNGIIYATFGNSGVYQSKDYGASWTWSTFPSFGDVKMITRGRNIYATGVRSIYTSPDNGNTWSSTFETGVPDIWINCLAEGANAFYVGTVGKSVWYRNFFSGNDIHSTAYAIENDTIHGIDPSITVEEFQSNVSVSYCASIEFEMINESGRMNGYNGVNRIKVVSEDGLHIRILNVAGAPGTNDVVTNIDEMALLAVEIYPVPTNDKLFIKNFTMISELQIVDGTGQKLPQQELRDGYLDVSHLPRGVYFLSVKSNGGKHQTVKFLKN
jgi:photosystem II stability/assembly factor-like uncharacterized protein